MPKIKEIQKKIRQKFSFHPIRNPHLHLVTFTHPKRTRRTNSLTPRSTTMRTSSRLGITTFIRAWDWLLLGHLSFFWGSREKIGTRLACIKLLHYEWITSKNFEIRSFFRISDFKVEEWSKLLLRTSKFRSVKVIHNFVRKDSKYFELRKSCSPYFFPSKQLNLLLFNMITLDQQNNNWMIHNVFCVLCQNKMGPAIFDYNKQLI